MPSQNGHRLPVDQICYYGLMESVGACISYVSVFAEMDNCSRLREERHLVGTSYEISAAISYGVGQFYYHRAHR